MSDVWTHLLRKAVAPELQRFVLITFLVAVAEVAMAATLGILLKWYFWFVFAVDAGLKIPLAVALGEGAENYGFRTLRNGAIGTGIMTLLSAVLTILFAAFFVVENQSPDLPLNRILLISPILFEATNLTFYVLLLRLFIKHAKKAYKRPEVPLYNVVAEDPVPASVTEVRR